MVQPTDCHGRPRFGKLRLLDSVESVPRSNKRMLSWICDCGRTIVRPPFPILTGRQVSCGMCNVLDVGYWVSAKFGKLRMRDPIEIHGNSSKVVAWSCDCGNIKECAVARVFQGRVKSCGRCDFMPPDFWKSARFGKLRMMDPAEVHIRSDRKVRWICDCGNETLVPVRRVTSGVTSSCGRCGWKKPEFWAGTKFGKLRMRDPKLLAPHSDEVVVWVCDCGRETESMVHHVFSGDTTSCGKCDWKGQSYWSEAVFGRLRMTDPIGDDLGLGSNKLVDWTCSCGGTVTAPVSQVTRGGLRSCARCYDRGLEWFRKNRQLLSELRVPISPSSIPEGWIAAQETVRNQTVPFRALCGACGSEYYPRWKDLKRGNSLTCGCVTFRISRANMEISEFVESLGFHPVLEHQVDDFKYDLFVPERNLIIEHNGLRWHSMPGSKRRDLLKYQTAVRAGYGFMSIFEDEWTFGRPKVESLIRNRLGSSFLVSVRPSDGMVRTVRSDDANLFYSSNHYIGPCRPKVSYGFFLGQEMVACASFGCPTRQSPHGWELIRMASDGVHRVHGIWSKIVLSFVREFSPGSIVSFSDNRFFSGKSYISMGFLPDGDVPSDYYWVKGCRRFHKSGLRKKKDEMTSGMTETQLRSSQGYRKVWDLGKRRWVWRSHV